MVIVTKNDVVTGLRELGLSRGHRVLVHSSLSSFGYVKGGADTIIDALIEVVSSSGTILVPTLTGHEGLSVTNPPTFDPLRTPSWTGRIPETFRKRPNAIRSIHPTHSVAAIGADAVTLTEDHILSVTPCDELSPYGKLAQEHDCYILLIGVDHHSSTTFHHIEEVVGVDYHIQEGFVKAKLIIDGKETYRHYMLHKHGTARDFNIMEPIFIDQGTQKSTKIGDSEVRLVAVKDMVQTTLRCLRVDRMLLCKR